ncbi:MAG TPA: carbohydrate binding domain-containing protein, partial [Acidobacteriaceae bacterium]|nr:carbohydrate binding domain-containing protein [Acidobacteriaceae bacterium]
MLRVQFWFSSSSLKMASAVLALAFFFTAYAGAQVIQTYDFESGAQGWSSFNGASTPVSTTASAYSGTHSLLTTTGSGGAGGPSIPLTSVLQIGAKYTITGWVMLTPGEAAANANFTMKRSDPTCTNGACYTTVGPYTVAVTSSGWAQIGGSFTATTTTETALTLYAQLVGATSAQSFYLDDVVITQTAPPPGGTPVVAYDFANGSTDGWGPFGSVQVTSTTPPVADPAGDADALLTSNRTATYMGPSIDLAGVHGIVSGATYQVTAYVLLASADASNPTVTLSLKRTDCAGTTYSNVVTSTPLSSSGWAKVQGTFNFSDLPGAPSSLVLYAQSSSATDSFYIAHVTINQLTPAPPDPSQQDNSGISSTFEDGGLDGWSSRSGSSVLTNTTGVAHSGTHSLLVTNRIGNWDGPSINVTNKMYIGSVYNISAWVMLQPTDGSTHNVNISLQATNQTNPVYPTVTAQGGVPIPADGNWHQIVVNNYTMGTSSDPGTAVTLYLQTVTSGGANDLIGFYLDDFQLSYVAPPTIQTDIPSIWKTYASDFPIGTAVDSLDLSGAHRDLLTMH